MPEDPLRSKLPDLAGAIVELVWLLLMLGAIGWLVRQSGRLLALW